MAGFGLHARIKGLALRAVAMCCSPPSDVMNNLKEASVDEPCERYVAAKLDDR